jgi:hypothetical protein
MVKGEAKTAWSCSAEAFDFAGDTAIFLAISKDAQSPIDSVSAAVAPIAVPAMIAFSLSAVISAVALVTRGYFAVVQCRRRRLDISGIGSTKPYSERLATKIEDGERTLKLTVLGLALGLCEDAPMTGIALFFFVNTHNVPLFPAISLVTSGLMFGMKLGPVMALPALWGKLAKWKSRLPPPCKATEPGVELCKAASKPNPAPARLTPEQYIARLEQVRTAVAELAAADVPACAAGDKLQFDKWMHHLTLMVDKAEEASNGQSNAPPAADPEVPPITQHVCTDRSTAMQRMHTFDSAHGITILC